MRKLYKDLLLVFLRSANLSVPYYIMLTLLLLYFGFCYQNYLQYSDIFSVTIWLTRPSILLIAFFIYLSYELVIRMYDNNMVEYLKTYKQGLLKAYGAILLCLLTIVMMPSIMLFAFVVFMYYYIDVQYLPFLVHLMKLSVLYFGLSFIIGIMLGTAMAAKLKNNRLATYTLTVFFILLNTTFTDAPFRIPYLLFESYFTERVLYYIKDFFTVVPHQLGSNFAIYPFYGFPMEPIRWFLALFWILFPLTLVLTECFYGKLKKVLVAASCLIILFGIGLFSVRGSTLLMDMRINSFAYADPYYYMNRPREDHDGFEAGFIIEEYKMDLTISNELHAVVEVTIDRRDLDSYEFTLYRGYILKSVHTEDGEIPFARESDYISIGSLNGANRLTFKYYGKSPKYIANRQAITLPGYFAYYPRAGRTNIWNPDLYGYVINILPNESIFSVNIRSNLEVFSNLAGGDNFFRGKSNGLSLFAGMYDEIAENIYAEPMRKDLPKREYIREAEEILADIFMRLDRLEYFIPISDKKFFQVPRSFALNSTTENLVVMSDHITAIFCNNGPELAESIMESIIRPKSGLEFNFMGSYLRYLFDRQDETASLYQKAVDLKLLLEEIGELQSLQEREANGSIDDEKRVFALNSIVSEEAAKYLFHESPRKEENMRIFFDYFTSEIEEEFLKVVERIIREDIVND